jgi:hypothetical protein
MSADILFEPSPRPLTPPPRLSIRIPDFAEPAFTPVPYAPESQRTWAVANEEEKQRSIRITRDFLNRIETEKSRAIRLRLVCDLYDELLRQPLLMAAHPNFRQTANERIYGLRDELKEEDDAEVVARFHWVVCRYDDLLLRLPSHPWWR